MAYNPYGAVSQIYKLKGQWDAANNAGDETAKSIAAQNAQQYYEQLKSNDYGDVAEQLSKSNYTQAKAINDKWAKMGKTSTRDYLYSLGQSKGMSKSDVDNLISWDNQSGEVSFGGKKIGAPDSIVDGVSYWSDTSVLDNAFNDYISRSGTTTKTGADNPAYNQSMQGATDKNNKLAEYIDSDRKDVQGKYKSIYDYANQDITKTDEYQSTYKKMMGKYDLSALQGRDNAVASGGASNGGNIDSYSAANAMRQQAALTATGQQIAHQAGLDAYGARVSNVAKILSDLGVYNSGTYDAMNKTIANDSGIAQQYFDNAETAANNKTDRLVKEANVTGYIPNEWTIKNDTIYSEFLSEDGTFKKEKENVDIQALINQAKARGDTETANKLSVVRARKIFGNYGDFGKYVNEGDLGTMTPAQTIAGKESAANIEETAKNNAVSRDATKAGISETAANNAIARLIEIANLTGYVPTELTIKTDPVYSEYLNEDGTFKKEKENVDIQALIDQYKAKGDTDTANKLSVVRARKILGNYSEFGKHANVGDIAEMTPQQTEAGRQYDVNAANTKLGIESNVKIAEGNNASNEKIAGIQADVARDGYISNETIAQIQADVAKGGYLSNETIAKIRADVTRDGYLSNETIAKIQAESSSNSSSGNKPSLTSAQARDALKSGEINQGTIDAYNYHYKTNYTVENPPKWDEKGNLIKTTLSDAEVESWVNALNKEIEGKYPGMTAIDKTGTNSYKKGDADADWIIIKVFESDSLTQEQKEYLLYDKFGITKDQVYTAMKDPHYR